MFVLSVIAKANPLFNIKEDEEYVLRCDGNFYLKSHVKPFDLHFFDDEKSALEFYKNVHKREWLTIKMIHIISFDVSNLFFSNSLGIAITLNGNTQLHKGTMWFETQGGNWLSQKWLKQVKCSSDLADLDVL